MEPQRVTGGQKEKLHCSKGKILSTPVQGVANRPDKNSKTLTCLSSEKEGLIEECSDQMQTEDECALHCEMRSKSKKCEKVDQQITKRVSSRCQPLQNEGEEGHASRPGRSNVTQCSQHNSMRQRMEEELTSQHKSLQGEFEGRSRQDKSLQGGGDKGHSLNQHRSLQGRSKKANDRRIKGVLNQLHFNHRKSEETKQVNTKFESSQSTSQQQSPESQLEEVKPLLEPIGGRVGETNARFEKWKHELADQLWEHLRVQCSETYWHRIEVDGRIAAMIRVSRRPLSEAEKRNNDSTDGENKPISEANNETSNDDVIAQNNAQGERSHNSEVGQRAVSRVL